MKSDDARNLPVRLDDLTREWRRRPFFETLLVVGLDIGLEGIGVCVRKGQEILHAETIKFELPEAKALEKRRQMRAARRCRENKAVRMRRLRALFEKHGLPWLEHPGGENESGALSKTDPFRLRLRAAAGNGPLASRQGLSLCIRHCVGLRGYDYHATQEGEFPWGDSTDYKEAMQWLAKSFVDGDTKRRLELIGQDLFGEDEEHLTAFLAKVEERHAATDEGAILKVLQEYNAVKDRKLKPRARGYNFPRALVWAHLCAIIRRHPLLLPDPEAFIRELGVKPNEDKDRAIFFYLRKTAEETERHFAKKVGRCPWAKTLGFSPGLKRNLRGDAAVRRWSILEFAATRRVELVRTEGKSKADKKKVTLLHRLSAAAIEQLVAQVTAHAEALSHNAQKDSTKVPVPDWKEAKAVIEADILAAHGKGTAPLPETKSTLNKTYWKHLKDLVVPSASNRSARAALSAESAARLFEMAVGESGDFSPVGIAGRLNEKHFEGQSYYEARRDPGAAMGLFPQVSFLMGATIQRGARAGEKAYLRAAVRNEKDRTANMGYLRTVFTRLKAAGKITQDAPDVMVVEVIGDPPRNKKQRKEREDDINKRRDEKEARFKEAGLHDTGKGSTHRRLTLWYQQRGRCPFTGLDLPKDPNDPTLDLEHLFPESLGGLSMDENLVLTWRAVNAAKGQRTPKEAAAAGFSATLPDGTRAQSLSWPAMLKNIGDMRWGEPKPGKHLTKRAIFEFPLPEDEESGRTIPDFGNTTRVSQLARQLKHEAALWMGIAGDTNAQQERIALPSGWHTAQARRSWTPKGHKKERDNLVHHLIDAVVLAHIPPREGLNDVRCGGIFATVQKTFLDADGQKRTVPVTWALPVVNEELFKPWLGTTFDKCPVYKHRSRSGCGSLGDMTFWRQQGDKLWQRTPLVTVMGKKNAIADADGLAAILRSMGIPAEKIPHISKLEVWLDKATQAVADSKDIAKEPEKLPVLRLNDGTPVKNLWKEGGKGGFTSPLGWTGVKNPEHADGSEGAYAFLRNLSVRYVRLELWLSWHPKRKEWFYEKRLIPDKRTVQHIKRLGFAWSRDKRRKAPAFMQKHRERSETHLTLRDIVCPPLEGAFSHKVGCFRRGDVFEAGVSPGCSLSIGPENPHWKTSYEITAFKGDGALVLKPVLYKKPGKGKDAAATKKLIEAHPLSKVFNEIKPSLFEPELATTEAMRNLLKLPAAVELASEKKLRPPSHKKPDDPPPNSAGGKSGTARLPGEADFRLE